MSSGNERKMPAGEQRAAEEIRIDDLAPADVGQEQEDALRGGLTMTTATSATDVIKDQATLTLLDVATQSCTDTIHRA